MRLTIFKRRVIIIGNKGVFMSHNAKKVPSAMMCHKRALPDELKGEYDKLARQIQLEHVLSGKSKTRIMFEWLLEGAKNG